MVELLSVGLIVALCAGYWARRLLPARGRAATAPVSKCGGCSACDRNGGCH
ncbi:FeoB-associated Cys-rich membrane protein [Acidomonas methanolica]|uniref:FeoB-associated Cys-rich membrane protein n=1 Tax=Acidomonas methanolica TaxID=437 RepID=UPI00104C3C75|nr:FeoB-associated Cys-rich membrane protein [Acidomonas methanolica]MBU2653763.1 hypothetical protein [Acidomonas methanolica]TCS31716.1 hypothetical protein EDC31_102268 [Acidomonas methanolica]